LGEIPSKELGELLETLNRVFTNDFFRGTTTEVGGIYEEMFQMQDNQAFN
jgi:hypothetical protein